VTTAEAPIILTEGAKTTAQIQVMQDRLAGALTSVLRALPAKEVLPITRCVMVRADRGMIEASATNLSLSIRTYCGAKVDDERAAFVVPGRQFSDFVKAIPPATVALKVVGRKQLQVVAGRSEAKIPGFDPEDFPRFPVVGEHGDVSLFSLPADALASAFKRVLPFVAGPHASRQSLESVLWKYDGKSIVRLCTGDGFGLAVLQVPALAAEGQEAHEWLIAAEVVRAFVAVAGKAKTEAFIRFDSQKCSLSIMNDNGDMETEIVGQLAVGVFPNFEPVISKGFLVRFAVNDAAALLSEIRLAEAAAETALARINLSFSSENVLGVRNQRLAEVATYEGEVDITDVTLDAGTRLSSCFTWTQSDRLTDAIDGAGTAVIFELTTPAAPIKIQAADGSFVAVIMPLFITEGS
jgi:DNA polymerase-3 subunit beta